ncbi:TorF family putative porin [Zhongshania borealis]|uniref:TorF family putative porin n=1 Tax=Zhongshania borealis TaxID=889488 RepID=A0ABP7W673_9GAMM
MFEKTLFMFSLCTTALLIPLTSSAHEDTDTQKSVEFTATATIATDYMFRGISQTLNDPAVHAAFDVSHTSGLSAGVWSSNVDSQDRGPFDDQSDQEIDIYIGYGTSLNEYWMVDATAIRYIFPGTASDTDLDWNELLIGVHFREYVSLLIGYSNKVFNLDDPGIYYGLSGNLPLSHNTRLTASLGYYDLDDALNDSYMDWSAGAEADMGMFTARLAYIEADNHADTLFGLDKADGRILFSLMAAFGE